MKVIEIAGGLWEEDKVELHKNYEHETTWGTLYNQPCPHAFNYRAEIVARSDESTYTRHFWIIPNVIVALNEGKCNSTGVCLDCLKENT